MQSITAVIVEDSELARLELEALLQAHSKINLVAQAWDVNSAITAINEHKPDLVFMDIDLPGGTAFDILPKLTNVPKLIFTTAFDQFALQAFDHNTVDYLLKPIKSARLAQAIEKLTGKLTEKPQGQSVESEAERAAVNAQDSAQESEHKPKLSQNHSFFIKDGEQCWVIKVQDLAYIESVGNYSKLFFNGHSAMHNMSLSAVEQRLDDSLFFKISRSHIVNINKIVHIEPWITGGFQVTLDTGVELEVSRRQAVKFKQAIGL